MKNADNVAVDGVEYAVNAFSASEKELPNVLLELPIFTSERMAVWV